MLSRNPGAGSVWQNALHVSSGGGQVSWAVPVRKKRRCAATREVYDLAWVSAASAERFGGRYQAVLSALRAVMASRALRHSSARVQAVEAAKNARPLAVGDATTTSRKVPAGRAPSVRCL